MRPKIEKAALISLQIYIFVLTNPPYAQQAKIITQDYLLIY